MDRSVCSRLNQRGMIPINAAIACDVLLGAALTTSSQDA